jgi:hypothetical protein
MTIARNGREEIGQTRDFHSALALPGVREIVSNI